MEKQVKQVWEQPVLEVLDVKMTMGGPNHSTPDSNGKGHNNSPNPS